MKKSILLIIICFISSAAIYAQSKKELKAEAALKEYETTKKLIENKEFEFEAAWATSQQGLRVNLNSNSNFLRIKKDSAEIYLPYFGTLSSAAAAKTNDGGIEFAGIMDDYEMNVNDKKQEISISFTARTSNDSFQYRMTIFKSGNTLINMNSNYRSVIKYDGKTRPIKDN